MDSAPELQKNTRSSPLALRNALGQRALILVIVQIRRVQNQASLLPDHFGELRVRVAERVHADSGDQIEIAFAGGVVNVAAFAAMQHERVAGVVLKQVLLFELDHGRRSGRCHLFIIIGRVRHSILKCFRCGGGYPMDSRAYLVSEVRSGRRRSRNSRRRVTTIDAGAPDRFSASGCVSVFAGAAGAGSGTGAAAGGTAAGGRRPGLAARSGLRALYLKDETRNPTRCLKDRATAVAMTLALECGATDVYCSSAGNAAISLAGFAAQRGISVATFSFPAMPRRCDSTG